MGGDDQKGRGELTRHAVHGDLALLHALQKAGLGPGGGAVDLVGQKDIAEHRAGPENELAGLLIVVVQARHIRGQQVRRELDAVEFSIQRAGKRFGQYRLSGAGYILQQDMSATAQRCQQHFHRGLTAHDHLIDILLDGR